MSEVNDRTPVVVAGRRSPIGRAFKGSLREVRPDDLAAQVVRAVLRDLPAEVVPDIEDVILGCAQPAGEAGYNLARVVGLLSGLPSAGGVTVNRYCASSLQAVRMAAHAVQAGAGASYVAAGVETLSRYVNGGADSGELNAAFAPAADHTARCLADDAEWHPGTEVGDVYVSMGATAEFVRRREAVSRRDMDEFAALSHARATATRDAGLETAAMVPVELADGTHVTRDDGIRPDTTADVLASLRPVFHPRGEVTAGNSCPLSDGAVALVVMSEGRAGELGLEPLVRIVDSVVTGVEPELMGLGPVPAVSRLLARNGRAIGDVDRVEINEAFAAQVLPCARRLGIDPARLNTRGGAIALGHPFGMTGARLVLSLAQTLAADDLTTGVAALCVGGGQGMAVLLERV
ncbi:acetyl-CoA C-acyltransferase [Pseudonocardia pini]|uniref:acetyl-CoA C-acyltransferase n=1 Tax=Pseudonocardia pini TaxID=2758030 RepID=UPI0015F03175|nr:acetyl-CoA C-acyltransferase [Pseudonocardia pini]